MRFDVSCMQERKGQMSANQVEVLWFWMVKHQYERFRLHPWFGRWKAVGNAGSSDDVSWWNWNDILWETLFYPGAASPVPGINLASQIGHFKHQRLLEMCVLFRAQHRQRSLQMPQSYHFICSY